MSDSVKFEFDNDSREKELAVIDGLRQFNFQYLGQYKPEHLRLFAHDENGEVVGGLIGNVLLGWLYIDILWVHEKVRTQGVGSRLLEMGLSRGKEMGAGKAYLDTMGFQAAPFYEKHGFREIYRFPNFANGFDRLVMQKDDL